MWVMHGQFGGYLLYGGYTLLSISEPWVFIMVLFSFISGFLIQRLMRQEHMTFAQLDDVREQLYQLNQENTELLESLEELSRLSTLAERDRLARKLHDDLGHELTGGLLALKAYESVVPESQQHSSFQALKSRLESSLTSLKDTVHGTEPEDKLAYERFQTMLDTFPGPPIKRHLSGDVAVITPEVWVRLLAVLKEGLTNVLKHAKPTYVDVT